MEQSSSKARRVLAAMGMPRQLSASPGRSSANPRCEAPVRIHDERPPVSAVLLATIATWRMSMQRGVFVCLGSMLLTLLISLLAGTRAEAQGIGGSSIGIFNQGSGLFIKTASEAEQISNGERIIQGFDIMLPNSTWIVRRAIGSNPTFYQLQLATTPLRFPLCLDNTDGSSTNRTPVQLWACNSSTTELWVFTHAPQGWPGYYIIQNARTAKCLDVRAGSLQFGAVIQIYDCTNSTTVTNWAQLWGVAGVANVPEWLPRGLATPTEGLRRADGTPGLNDGTPLEANVRSTASPRSSPTGASDPGHVRERSRGWMWIALAFIALLAWRLRVRSISKGCWYRRR